MSPAPRRKAKRQLNPPGLPVRIYVSEELDFDTIDTPHIKVQNNYNSQIKGKCFLVSISDVPKIIQNKAWRIKQEDLEKVYKFIKLNKLILLKLRNGVISQIDFGKNLKSISQTK